jgi:AI-2 transport protein TqsA
MGTPHGRTRTMNLNLTTVTRYGLNVLAALGASIAFYFGKPIFIPVVIAGLLAAILWPGANWLHKRLRMAWFLSCCTVVLSLVFLVLLIFALVGVSFSQILNDIPKPNDEASMQNSYSGIRDKFREAFPFVAPKSFNSVLPQNAEDSGLYREIKRFFYSEQFTSILLNLTGHSLGLLTESVLVIFTLLFLLVEGQMLLNKIRNIFGPMPESQSQVSTAFRELAESVRSYLVWRTIINIGLGILLGVFYYLIGLKQHAVLWALLTVILCYIPYLGTIAAGVLPVLDAIITVSPWTGTAVLIFYIVVVTIEGYLIVPWMMGRSMDLNATTVIVSCLYWYLVWGTAGLFLAMPIMAGIRVICSHVPGWEPWGSLMSSEEEPVKAEPPEKPKEEPITLIPSQP